MKLTYTLLVCLFLASLGVNAQENQGAVYIGTADGHTYVPSLASRMNELTPYTVKAPKEAQDGRSFRPKRNIVPGKGRQADILSQEPHELNQKVPGRTPDLVWVGATSGSQPTDPSLAVGPDHVLVVFNTGFAIYDKDGVELVGQTAPNPAIFPQGGCCDLTVSYDPVAVSAGNPTPGRWVLSFLGGGAQVAVSDGPDPVNDGWNVYNINTINDYQKLSVWSDGYYVSDQANGNRIYAMERQAMIDGEAPGNVSIQGFNLPDFNNQGFASVQALNISDDDYPGPGNATVVFFQDDAYPGQSDDSIKFWDLDVDFDTPANSTISTPQEVLVTPFTSIFDGTSFANLTQPNGGADIDALQGIIMNQAQYKKFPSYESAIFNFVIDVGTSGEQAAIRWYEFRRNTPTDPWTMEQEGTFADPDGRHYWHGSMIMDTQGNIGMGFSVLGNAATGNGTADEFVSSYYTGRLAADPLGTMTIAPQLIAQGAGNIPGLRYGDYSKIDLDPDDYKRMYFINEMMFPGRSDVVGRFQVAPNFNIDGGVIDITAPIDGDLSAPQSVTVTVRNFGLDPMSTFDVTYQVDSGPVVTEAYSGATLNAGETASFTFATTADLSTQGQTYTITAATVLPGDQDLNNDTYSEDVTHLLADDLGVTAITSPTSGSGLTATEDVTVTITNFGFAAKSNFDVTYDLDGSTVTEQVAGPLAGNSSVDYTFTQTADLSALGTYNLSATTSLSGDQDTANDETSVVIDNILCAPALDCSLGDGFQLFEVADLSNPSGCEGYGDFTSLVANMEQGTDYNLTITTGWGSQHVNVWIDFNDDFNFTPDELVVDDFVIADGQGQGSYTETTTLSVPAGAAVGQHLMRAKSNWNAPVPADPCTITDFGETEDYTANIGTLGIGDLLDGNNLEVFNRGNDLYEVVLATTSYAKILNLSIHNVLGQQIYSKQLENENGVYNHEIDMSYLSSGVYIVRLGNDDVSQVKKIVVQ